MTDPIQRDYERAQEFLAEGQFQKVLAVLTRMRDQDENDPRTIEIAGDLAKEHGDLDEAEQLYLRLDDFKDDPEVRGIGQLSLGFLSLEQDDSRAACERFAEACRWFNDARAIDHLTLAFGALGQARAGRGEYREAVNAFRSLIQAANQWEEPEELAGPVAEATRQLADVLRLLGELDEAESTFRDAIARFEDFEHLEGKANCLDGLGIIAQIRGRYDEAETLHLKALKINKLLDHEEGMSVNYGNLTMLNLHRKDLDRAERYARKALKIDRRLENANGVAHFYNLLGQIETDREHFQSAEDAFTKAEKLYRSCGDREDLASVTSHFGVLYRKWGRLDEAEARTLNAMTMAEEMSHGDGLAATHDELALIRKSQGRIDEARALWLKALALYEELQSRRMIAEVRAQLEQLDAESP
ncbi:tetratricopeptide repeat protein [Tautonia rosea]|uniref:tetratricopeptide repeat protein n=1 Tax=Tautonia rosea TaxID=2728037 RepID=UPI001475D9A8|nr:tetratricopeptide repeat protein [Tautonia rosea]